jgi:hypothetical protein
MKILPKWFRRAILRALRAWLDWGSAMTCSAAMSAFSEEIDACSQEMMQACGAGGSEEQCIDYLDSKNARNPSDAILACLAAKDPSAFQALEDCMGLVMKKLEPQLVHYKPRPGE